MSRVEQSRDTRVHVQLREKIEVELRMLCEIKNGKWDRITVLDQEEEFMKVREEVVYVVGDVGKVMGG